MRFKTFFRIFRICFKSVFLIVLVTFLFFFIHSNGIFEMLSFIESKDFSDTVISTQRYSYKIKENRLEFFEVDHDAFHAYASSLGYESEAPYIGPLSRPSTYIEYDYYDDNITDNEWTMVASAIGGHYPSTVCLTIDANDEKFRGTGFMIGPNTVATCAHCVYSKEHSGDKWPDKVKVVPAMSGSAKPFGSAYVTEVILPAEWVHDFDPDFDWAILRLDRTMNVGMLGLKWQDESYDGTKIMINGYPSKVGSEFNDYMYRTDGIISDTHKYQLLSKNSHTDGGMSGAPVYINSPTTGYTAIGIFSGYIEYRYTENQYSCSTRITRELYNELISYRSVSK